MASLYTIPQIISIGRASAYLMANDYYNGVLFGTRLVKETSSVLLNYSVDALAWQYETNPSDTSLRGAANYVLWLSGKYIADSQSGSGGGSVIPIPPSGTAPNRIDFFVSSDSLIPTGGNTVTLLNFIGYNLDFNRGNQPQLTISDGTSTWFTWNKVTGVFVCYGAAAEGEPFSLIPSI